MQFNISKCKVLHLGARNAKQVYTMDGEALQETLAEKDIAVYVSQKLKTSAEQRQGLPRHVFVKLNKQYVRPHLEFCR